MHSAGTMENASTLNWSMASMKLTKAVGHSTREKLRNVERHCTRPTTILKIAEACRQQNTTLRSTPASLIPTPCWYTKDRT